MNVLKDQDSAIIRSAGEQTFKAAPFAGITHFSVMLIPAERLTNKVRMFADDP